MCTGVRLDAKLCPSNSSVVAVSDTIPLVFPYFQVFLSKSSVKFSFFQTLYVAVNVVGALYCKSVTVLR